MSPEAPAVDAFDPIPVGAPPRVAHHTTARMILLVALGLYLGACENELRFAEPCTKRQVLGEGTGTVTIKGEGTFPAAKYEGYSYALMPNMALPLGWECPSPTPSLFVYHPGPYQSARTMCEEKGGVVSHPIREPMVQEFVFAGHISNALVGLVSFAPDPYVVLVDRDGKAWSSFLKNHSAGFHSALARDDVLWPCETYRNRRW